MTAITRLALSHRRLVAVAWIALAAAGVLGTSSATSRLTHSFATPGSPGYDTNEQIRRRFGIDGNEQPTLAVLHLPARLSMRTSAGRAVAARIFAAAHRAGHLDVVDYEHTANARLISRDGRTTWALLNMPNPDLPTRWHRGSSRIVIGSCDEPGNPGRKSSASTRAGFVGSGLVDPDPLTRDRDVFRACYPDRRDARRARS